jgi:predicted nucleic-acid-binding protein
VIAVDTNVLVRLLVGDDAAQEARARKLFDGLAESDDRAWISDTVLVELVWTLGRAYDRSREEQLTALTALAGHGSVVLESDAAVRQAMADFERSQADFADCLLAAKAARAGCGQLVTFDRGMKKLPLVLVI